MSGYDQHQRNARRLLCTICQKLYDVTNAETLDPKAFICAFCTRPRVTDVNGVPMEGGDSGP